MVEDIKLNVKKGTYEEMQEHYGEIGDKDFCLVEDKDVPIPFEEDAGKIISVDNEGKYTLINPSSGGNAKNLIELSGSSGTLTNAEFDLLNDNTKVVEFMIGERIFKFSEAGTTFLTFSSITYPSVNTQSIQELYIQIDPDAVNYKQWSIQDIVISNVIQSVTIEQPESATSGTLSAEGLALLQENDSNYIIFANEIYRLNDKQTSLGWLVYTHIGQDTQGQFFVKCIVITILTRSWVLNILQLSGQ